MTNNRQLNRYFQVLVFTFASFCVAMQTPPSVATFLNDALAYHIPNIFSRHRLDPGVHVLTVGQFAERLMAAGEPLWSDEGAQLCRTFTERDKYLMAIAAYYHDIGKFGADPRELVFSDEKVTFSGRDWHELIGFYYALAGILDDETLRAVGQHLSDVYGIDCTHLHEYILLSGERLKNPFDWAGLMLAEHQLLAVLIGAHKAFTQVCMNDTDFAALLPEVSRATPEEFVAFLRDLCAMAGLQTGVDEKLINMVILLTIADSRAVFFTADTFVPSRIVGPEYVALLGARRNSLHGTDFWVGGKPWPDGERVFQERVNTLLVQLAHCYRPIICALLSY